MSIYYEVKPEDSDFYTIGIDVTHRCNMNCKNCYSPERLVEDFKKNDLISVFNNLKKRTEIRFTGGEPTLRQDLPELIMAAKKAKHRVAIMTNGIKLSDLEYCKNLYDAGLRFVCISLNGADDDRIYTLIDNQKCAFKKMTALDNCIKTGFFININLIVVKGINEHCVSRIIDIVKRYNIKCTIRFRNIGQIGNHMKQENYTFQELLDLIPNLLNIQKPNYQAYHKVNGHDEDHNVLFPLSNEPSNKIWIKITDWAPVNSNIPDPGSKRRGRLTQNLMIAPFFENVELNGY
ncbi:MAG: hypothetical protein A2622_14125 [Bdellovibrionales bacterium RIFCSPHIGHO2_01_FULL_40_29]|nr:MAG: hypothetical protein A2622_14125 [Bdellovibrionales bacterium RIFCSPHIGHO2_01_FULL_40_29]OFZ33658.1 MAG: hypothetical protein A3D17_11735 [Bdellovibrionales bacterium RIFCSPHIGHO2_02_FULL_40_15]